MSTVKYHREQAKVLAALAVIAENPKNAKMYNLAVIDHLERAEDLERTGLVVSPSIGNTAIPGRNGNW